MSDKSDLGEFSDAVDDLKSAMLDEIASMFNRVGPLRLLLFSVFASGVLLGALLASVIP